MNLRFKPADRRYFIGGSDARIIMGNDEAALLRLWREKRGEVEPEDLSGNPIVQLGLATEPLNRLWYERNTGQVLTQIQSRVRHPVVRWMAATLDGWSRPPGRFSKPNSCCPGPSPKRGRPRNTWPNFNTTCGSPMPSCRSSRSSPVAANGSRSPSRPIASTSTCC